MKFNFEKRIEDLIFENKANIHKYGFLEILGETHRQYILPSGKKIDIVSFDKMDDEVSLNIIEIKKDEISGQNGIVQAYEYASELTEVLFSSTNTNTIYLKVVLVGYECKDLSITKFLSFLPDIYTYTLSWLDGIKFNKKSEGGIVCHKNEGIDQMLDALLINT